MQKKASSKEIKTSEYYYRELTNHVFAQKDSHLYGHLQYICSSCGEYIRDTIRWECKECTEDFYNLCNECYIKHTNAHCHRLVKENLTIAEKLIDDTPIMSTLFDSRREFLSFCITNHYQFNQVKSLIMI